MSTKQLVPLKSIADINQVTLSEKTDPDTPIRYIDIGSVSKSGFNGKHQDFTFETAPSRARRKLKKGSTIIATVRTYLKAVAFFEKPSKEEIVSTGFAVLDPKNNIDQRYLYYRVAADDFVQEVEANSVGVSYPAINPSNLGKLKLSISGTKDEQREIADYLDTKTQTLDKILSAKNHTHTHLSELRQAIITNAVLGAGGTAMNLQDTHIPWIGKIPAHWQVEKIKGVADIVLGKMLQSTEKEGYVLKPYLRAQNIRWEKVDVSGVNEMWFSPNEISQYRLKEGDILVSEGGEVGRAAMWHNELDECYIQNSVNRLRVQKKKILPEYLLYVLESYGQAKVFENTVNRVSIAHLTREKLKEYAIPLPPLDEQREIVANIQKRLSNIDKADALLQKSINQLEEYRSSLISNVVGGKVEV